MVRSATALAGGLVRELGDVALPAAVRRTKLYQTLVEGTLRFLIEEVGGVEGAYPPEGRLAEGFAIRRAAGNGIEWVGILTFRASPVWVMAALADISGAGRQLIQEISETLKQEGLLDRETKFETVDQILDGLEKSAGRLAEAINTPPLDVDGLRQEWAAIRRELQAIPPRNLPSADLVRRSWEELKKEAAAQTGPSSRCRRSWRYRPLRACRRTCAGCPVVRVLRRAARASSLPARCWIITRSRYKRSARPGTCLTGPASSGPTCGRLRLSSLPGALR